MHLGERLHQQYVVVTSHFRCLLMEALSMIQLERAEKELVSVKMDLKKNRKLT